MPFIRGPQNNQAQQLQQGFNMIMATYGQKKLAEREQQQQENFDKQFALQEKKYNEMEKIRQLELKQLTLGVNELEKKAKMFDDQQKNVEAYNKEIQTLRDQGKLDAKTHMQIRSKYASTMPSLGDIKSFYTTEDPATKRAAELENKKAFWKFQQDNSLSDQEKSDLALQRSKQLEDYKQQFKTASTPMQWYFMKNRSNKGLTAEDVAKADKMFKNAPSVTPFNTFYKSPEMHGKTSGEISKLWHEARKADLIEVSRARYPTKQQIPDVPGLTFDRRTGGYYMPGLDGVVPVAPEDFGLLWAGKYQMAADKSALREITKRNELVKSFAKRIEVNSPIIMELAERVGNKNIKLLNTPINELWKQGVIGDGDLASLKLAMTSLSNELAKLESGSIGIAGASVEQMQIMATIHNTNIPINEIQKVIDTGILLSTTLEGALEGQRLEIIERIKNWSMEDKQINNLNDEFDIKVKKVR